MTNVVLGQSKTGPMAVALDVLVDTRLLIQANSGGGKSWCLRRLLEQTHGRVQHLVVDPEGEFASLRERFDYVLAARNGGDTAADPRSAKLLAERLLELGVSAILDIYELKAHDRIRFVRYFLEALIDAPKKLWHPAIVVVDEAHLYCPQVGEAESASAVIDLATRGRKRGFCAALATQRLSKLHKDAAAECNNKLIGRTGLDVDVKRAADELGFGKERWRDLRELAAGAFFAFGPALSPEVTALVIGPVITTHPKAGARLVFTAPPPTDKVKALLPKLADLPAEAEERQRSLMDLQAENAKLRREIRSQSTVSTPVMPMKRVEVSVLKDTHVKRLEAAVDRLGGMVEGARADFDHRWEQLSQAALDITGTIRTKFAAVAQPVEHRPRNPEVAGSIPARRAILSRSVERRFVVQRAGRQVAPGADLPRGEARVLTAIAQYPNGVTREQVTILTGYKSSTRNAYIQRAGERGHVAVVGDQITATQAGVDALGADFEPLPTGDALLDHWRGRLPDGERRVLDVVVAAYPKPVEREAISEATGFKHSTRNAYLQRLGSRRLVVAERGQVRAAEELFG